MGEQWSIGAVSYEKGGDEVCEEVIPGDGEDQVADPATFGAVFGSWSGGAFTLDV